MSETVLVVAQGRRRRRSSSSSASFYIDTDNYTPYLPFGFGGAVTGAATVFFAVFGYDAMSTAAEESKDAQRHMPKAII